MIIDPQLPQVAGGAHLRQTPGSNHLEKGVQRVYSLYLLLLHYLRCIYWIISLNLDKKLRQNSTFLTMKSKTLSTQKNLGTLDERCTTTTIRRRFKTRKMGPFVKFRWRHFLTLRAVQTGYLKRETIYINLVRLLTLTLKETITDNNTNDSQHITTQ